jgi:opacity protein-like surface antigen
MRRILAIIVFAAAFAAIFSATALAAPPPDSPLPQAPGIVNGDWQDPDVLQQPEAGAANAYGKYRVLYTRWSWYVFHAGQGTAEVSINAMYLSGPDYNYGDYIHWLQDW